MTREEYIAANPIEAVLQSKGVQLIGQGAERKCRCPFHEDKTPSFSVNVEKGLWRCFGGCGAGSVIDLVAKFEGKTAGDILRDSGEPKPFKPIPPRPQSTQQSQTVDCVYEYKTATGNPAFEVVRYKPKTFRQRHTKDGKVVWGMDGVERVLFRLPEVLRSPVVALCEGEKDALRLTELGFCGTCNVGGAGKWLEGYTESLKGKDVLIFGDNDEPGKKHVELVFDSLAGKVKTARIIEIPKAFKDVSDFAASFKTNEEAKAAIDGLIASATPFVAGVKLPLYSVAELEDMYLQHVTNLKASSFSLGEWLPSFNRLRPLCPGELVMFIGNTGIGKTAILSSIAIAARKLPTVFFQLELPLELMFERLVAARLGMSGIDVEKTYAQSGGAGREILNEKFPKIQVCCESGLNLERMEQIIDRAELKMGERPKVVFVDYVQLVAGSGKDRRDKFSNIAEGLKVLAKKTRTVIFIASQISRPDGESPEVGLHDAKETGSLENSCGLVIGAWRDVEDSSLMMLRVLKSTKGGAGLEIPVNFDGATMTLKERAKINESDIP